MADWAAAIASGLGAAANTGAGIIGDQMRMDQQLQAEQRAADIKLDLNQRMSAAEEMMKNRAAERFSGIVRDQMGQQVPVAPQSVQQTGLTDASAGAEYQQADGSGTASTALHGDMSVRLKLAQDTLASPNATLEQKQDAKDAIEAITAQTAKQAQVNAKGVEGKTRARTIDEASQAALDWALQNDAPAYMAGTGMLATAQKQDVAERTLKLREQQIAERLEASKSRTEMMGEIARIRLDAAQAVGAKGGQLPSDAKMIEYLVQNGMDRGTATDRVTGTGAGATKDPVAMATSLASSLISNGSVRVTKDDPAGTTLASKAMAMAMDQIGAAEGRFRGGAAPPSTAGGAVPNPVQATRPPLSSFRK